MLIAEPLFLCRLFDRIKEAIQILSSLSDILDKMQGWPYYFMACAFRLFYCYLRNGDAFNVDGLKVEESVKAGQLLAKLLRHPSLRSKSGLNTSYTEQIKPILEAALKYNIPTSTYDSKNCRFYRFYNIFV